MLENKTQNAKYIYDFFIAKGWTSQAICALLGNIEVESGIQANLNERSGGGGYGLVQWTPKSKLVQWANSKNLDYASLKAQCLRIQWEVDNNQQYYKTSAYPLTFKQFTQSTLSPTYLAQVFIHNYERPANPNQPIRGQNAEKWHKLLSTNKPNTYSYKTTSTTITAKTSSKFTYTIKSGDTLGSIATKYGVTVANLQSWNNIQNVNKIAIGQKLNIKINSKTAIKAKTNAKKKSSTKSGKTYIVKSGDTLSDIATKYGVTVSKLESWNKISDPNKIKVGQKLRVK